MGDLITRKEWSNTPLGPYSQWSQQLLTTLNIMLDSRFPMFLFWGEQMICFYNDAYRPYLGNGGKHPSILGTGIRETSPESWPVIGPYLTKVMETGEAYSMEDFRVPIHRHGKLDEWFGALSFSPVIDQNGNPAAVLAICFETSNKEAVLREAMEREDQLNFILEAAELGTWDYNPGTGTFMANKRLKEWFGLPDTEHIDLELAMRTLGEADRERLRNAIHNAITRRFEERHDITYTITHPVTGVKRIVRAKGKAFFSDNESIAYRFNGTLQDITEEVLWKKRLKKSEENFRDLLEHSPVAMCLFHARDHRIVSMNENMLMFLNKTSRQVIGQPFLEILPVESISGLRVILDKVCASGIGYSAYNHPFRLPRGNRMAEVYVDFAYEPILNDKGSVESIIVAASEVTEQVLLQKKLDRKKDELKRQMLKASIDAQEKEREVISNELHDNVNQLLACTKLFLELIESGEENTRVCVSRGSAFIGQAMEEIRDISHALNPGILCFVGLFKSIREMLEKLNRTTAIIFSFDSTHCKKEWKRNADIELAIFRIVQNQVTNIIQHSGAVSADIALSSGVDFMELVITDDGKGFDTKTTRKGLGFLNIISRAELLNGSVSLHSAPGKGCRLKIRIPAAGRRIMKAASPNL